MAGNYYDKEFDPWVSSIRNVGQMIMQVPQMRAQAMDLQAQAQERAQRGMLYQTQAETSRSEKAKLDAETAGLSQENQGYSELSDALTSLAADPNDTKALAKAFSSTGKIIRKDPEGKSKAMGTILGQLKVLQGGQSQVPIAAALADAPGVYKTDQQTASANYKTDEDNEQRATAAELMANRPMAVHDNSQVYDPVTKSMVATSLQDVGIGHKLFGPQAGKVGLTQVAEGAPTPDHSAATDVARARFVEKLMAREQDAGKRQQALDAYDAAMEGEPQPTPEAPVVPPKPGIFDWFRKSGPAAQAAAPKAPAGPKVLDRSTAADFLKQAGGNKDQARALAKQAGYTW